MELGVNFLSVFALALISVSLVLLFKKKHKELSDKILVAIFIFLIFVPTASFATINKINWLTIICLAPSAILESFVAPTLLIHIKSLFEEPKKLIQRNAIHYIAIPIQTLLVFVLTKTQNDTLFFYYMLIITLYSLVYLFISLRTLINYTKQTKNIISTSEKYDFKWVKILIIGFIVVQSTALLMMIPEELNLISVKNSAFLTITLFNVVIIYLSYYSLTQTRLLLPNFLIEDGVTESDVEPNVSSEVENNTKKVNSHVFSSNSSITHQPETLEQKEVIKTHLLTEQEATNIQQQLQVIFKEQQPHLDADLTLAQLAKLVHTSSKKLSYYLNHFEEQKFYDYINNKRVEAVKEKLNNSNYENYTLLAIAIECGFNSKTTFNRIFKKVTGASPSAYRNNLQKTNN